MLYNHNILGGIVEWKCKLKDKRNEEILYLNGYQ